MPRIQKNTISGVAEDAIVCGAFNGTGKFTTFKLFSYFNEVTAMLNRSVDSQSTVSLLHNVNSCRFQLIPNAKKSSEEILDRHFV